MTDTLNRINTVLGGWEAQPDTTDVDGWLPGDPLYRDPRTSFLPDQQIVRPMIDLFEDGNAVAPARCTECDVRWVGDAACFVCGQKVPDHGVQVSWTFTDTDPSPARAMVSFSEQMRLVAEAFDHEFDRAIARQLEAAVPVDGVLYMGLHSSAPFQTPEGWNEIGPGQYARQAVSWASAGTHEPRRLCEPDESPDPHWRLEPVWFTPAPFGPSRTNEPERPTRRWAKIEGSARRISDTELELLLVAGINDRRYVSRIVLEQTELARYPSLYGDTLDKMVARLERMASQQTGPPPPRIGFRTGGWR